MLLSTLFVKKVFEIAKAVLKAFLSIDDFAVARHSSIHSGIVSMFFE
jgi:hypothetical protein